MAEIVGPIQQIIPTEEHPDWPVGYQFQIVVLREDQLDLIADRVVKRLAEVKDEQI